MTEQKALNLLFKESHEKEDVAIAMLDKAIAKGWQGWVAIDDTNHYGAKRMPLPEPQLSQIPNNDWN